MIVLGNGGDAIIGYVSAAYLRPGDELITGWPSFPTYVIDAAKQEARVITVPLRDGAFDLEAIAERIGPRTRLIWICTPNNPTGGVVDPADLRAFLDIVPEQVLVVIDEAYYEFCAEPGRTEVGCRRRARPRSPQCRGAAHVLQALRARRDARGLAGRAGAGRGRGGQVAPLLRHHGTVGARGHRQRRRRPRDRAAP
jgi:DNA-binding transcriptional MocR family regulator